ncbi:MAG: signal peptidase II [Planctomycetota bacterium]
MNRSPSRISRTVLALLILSTCIGCDQATKRIATEWLADAPPRSYLSNTVRLEYALNPGGFLSLGSQLPANIRYWLFVVANAVLLLTVARVLTKSWNMQLAMFVALAYFLAGGLGNLVDRVTQDGLVTDFLNVGIGPLRTGIFNVADIAVTFGGIAFAILYSRQNDSTKSGSLPVTETQS